jgi:adenosylmethionine-8-amino-7-oxononanoate aminotransferase
MTVRYPDGNVLLRNLSRTFPVVTHGEGIWLFDEDGKRYLDAAGGAMVASVGHGNREVADAIHAQMLKVGYVNGTQFTTEVMETFARRLCARAPGGLNRLALLSSGSEAVEAAVKFVRQLWVEHGETERSVFIARTPGYHGNTLFALSASARPHYRKLFKPLLSDVVMVPAPYEYRSGLKDYAKEGADHYARQLEETIERIGPKRVAGFLAEPVIGSSAGASLPPPGYFEKVQALCRKHGILIVADEVLCGAGRTGKFFASEHFGLEPDVITLGKGINGGYVPVSALLVHDKHLREMKNGTGYFVHMQTYMQSPSMAAAGLACLDYMERHKLIENSASTGAYLHEKLRSEILPLPFVGNVAGKGLLAGVELVRDKATRAPFARAEKKVEALVAAGYESGLTLWPNTGHADDTNGDLVMLAPPLTITRAEVDELIRRLRTTIEAWSKGA